MMKKTSVFSGLVFLAVFLAGSVFAGVRFSYFNTDDNSGRVVLTWGTEMESHLARISVERSIDGIEYMEIATFEPKGSGSSYQYIDTDIYKQSTRTFYYRIVATDTAGQPQYSSVKRVTVTISPVQQTWGSLKAMFR